MKLGCQSGDLHRLSPWCCSLSTTHDQPTYMEQHAVGRVKGIWCIALLCTTHLQPFSLSQSVAELLRDNPVLEPRHQR